MMPDTDDTHPTHFTIMLAVFQQVARKHGYTIRDVDTTEGPIVVELVKVD